MESDKQTNESPGLPDDEQETMQAARRKMVERDLRKRGIYDQRVLSAMGRIPREAFVPESHRHVAYSDQALPISAGQTISQPYMVALMTQLLELRGDERVLEIGTGSGYQCAILAELAREVISVERLPELASEAQTRLAELGYDNAEIVCGDGTLGWPEKAPYDRILVTAAAPRCPQSLEEQLAEGGLLVVPVGTRDVQNLHRVRRRGDTFESEAVIPCRFVPLLGREGWQLEQE